LNDPNSTWTHLRMQVTWPDMRQLTRSAKKRAECKAHLAQPVDTIIIITHWHHTSSVINLASLLQKYQL